MNVISPSAAQLLADVHTLGIDLQAHGDGIRFRPRHAMTPDLLQRLQTHKAELLAILARKALEKVPQPVREVNKPVDPPRQPSRRPWSLTPEEEATICRVIEKDQGLPPGSLRLYTPQDFRRLMGEKWR